MILRDMTRMDATERTKAVGGPTAKVFLSRRDAVWLRAQSIRLMGPDPNTCQPRVGAHSVAVMFYLNRMQRFGIAVLISALVWALAAWAIFA